LQPHRRETFKLPSDPMFVDKVRILIIGAIGFVGPRAAAITISGIELTHRIRKDSSISRSSGKDAAAPAV
jgi:hypothetical protein